MSLDAHPTGDFAGRSALITGGSRGIGFGIATELLGRGASVCITARKTEELGAAVARLDPERSGRVTSVAGSADNEAHQQSAVEHVIDTFGRLDMLVNNAAVNPHYGSLADAPLGAVRKIFEVNLVAVLGWTQQAWRAWMKVNGGGIVNVASLGAVAPSPELGAYSASKAALIHLTRVLAYEFAPSTRVNAIAPAVIKTDFARALYEDDEAGVAARYPLKRLGTPEDTARLAAFLLSDQSGWITGETVVIDGGLTSIMF